MQNQDVYFNSPSKLFLRLQGANEVEFKNIAKNLSELVTENCSSNIYIDFEGTDTNPLETAQSTLALFRALNKPFELNIKIECKDALDSHAKAIGKSLLTLQRLNNSQASLYLRLKFADNYIKDDIANAIVKNALSLENHFTGLEIDLSGNLITDKGVKTISDSLINTFKKRKYPDKFKINFSLNLIKNSGVMEIIKLMTSGILAPNSHIKLNLCCLNNQAFNAILQAIQSPGCPVNLTINLAKNGEIDISHMEKEIKRAFESGSIPVGLNIKLTPAPGISNFLRNNHNTKFLSYLQFFYIALHLELPIELIEYIGRLVLGYKSDNLIKDCKDKVMIIYDQSLIRSPSGNNPHTLFSTTNPKKRLNENAETNTVCFKKHCPG